MALGTENLSYQQSVQRHRQLQQQHQHQHQHQHQVLRTRNACQRTISSVPYSKSAAYCLSGTTLDSNNPAVIRRNARERNRVKQVNNGFSNLRQHIPNAIIAEVSNGRRGIGPGANKKLSKVDTLRMAAEYIRRLKNLIDEVDNSDASSVSSYGSSICASYVSNSPLHSTSQTNNYYQQASIESSACYTISYIGSFQQQREQEKDREQPQQQQQQQQQRQQHQQQHQQLISPANSTTSSTYSTDTYYDRQRTINHQHQSFNSSLNSTPVKSEQSCDDYNNNNNKNNNINTVEDEELLDYISLWQDE